MKIYKNPSVAEFYVESNGQIKNGGFSITFLELWTRQILKGVKHVSKNLLIQDRNPRCKLDCHFPPFCQISALQP